MVLGYRRLEVAQNVPATTGALIKETKDPTKVHKVSEALERCS